jgi:hypothetical protein
VHCVVYTTVVDIAKTTLFPWLAEELGCWSGLVQTEAQLGRCDYHVCLPVIEDRRDRGSSLFPWREGWMDLRIASLSEVDGERDGDRRRGPR